MSSLLIKKVSLCNRPLYKITANQNGQLWNSPLMDRYIFQKFLHLILREYCRWGNRMMVRAQGPRGFQEIVCSSNIRNYTHKLPLTWLPKYKQNMVSISGHTKVDGRKTMKTQPYAKNYRHLIKLQVGEGDLPQNKAHQLVSGK